MDSASHEYTHVLPYSHRLSTVVLYRSVGTFFLNFQILFRVQNSLLFFNDDWPGYRLIAVKNIIIVTAGCLSSIFYDRVSFILSVEVIMNNLDIISYS